MRHSNEFDISLEPHSVEIAEYSVTKILREIKVCESTDSKFTILTHLESLNFDCYVFLLLSKTEIHQSNKIHAVKSPKLISRKIWAAEKFLNFHTVQLQRMRR